MLHFQTLVYLDLWKNEIEDEERAQDLADGLRNNTVNDSLPCFLLMFTVPLLHIDADHSEAACKSSRSPRSARAGQCLTKEHSDPHSFAISLSLIVIDLFQTLIKLDLSYNLLGDEAIQNLADILRHSKVDDLIIRSSSWVYLFEQTLTELDLSYNDIAVKGAEQLADALRNNAVNIFFSPFAVTCASSHFCTDTRRSLSLWKCDWKGRSSVFG